jgi:hypothetical protein
MPHPSKKAKKETKKKPWQEIAKEAQQHRDASIAMALKEQELPPLPTPLPKNVMGVPGLILSRREREITEMLPEELLGMLAAGELRAVDVTMAFLRRAALAQQLVCYTLMFRTTCDVFAHFFLLLLLT